MTSRHRAIVEKHDAVTSAPEPRGRDTPDVATCFNVHTKAWAHVARSRLRRRQWDAESELKPKQEHAGARHTHADQLARDLRGPRV